MKKVKELLEEMLVKYGHYHDKGFILMFDDLMQVEENYKKGFMDGSLASATQRDEIKAEELKAFIEKQVVKERKQYLKELREYNKKGW